MYEADYCMYVYNHYSVATIVTEIAISDYVDWRSGEPQAHEYCLASEYLSWYGRACTDRYDFVCEG